MMKYEISFREDKCTFISQDGFPDKDTAMFFAKLMTERACEKFE